MTETNLEKENTKTQKHAPQWAVIGRDQGASWLRGDGHGGRSTQDTGGQAHAEGLGFDVARSPAGLGVALSVTRVT